MTEEIWSNLPGRETRLIIAPWPEPLPEYEADADALAEAQTAARIYRRSGVRVRLAGDAQRIFESVVRPGEDGAGDREAEVARVRKELERVESKLANKSFTDKAPQDVVEAEEEKRAQYRAELEALGG